MQKIMFDHRRFGLEQAVLERLKTMTRRGARLPDGLEPQDVWNPVMGIDDRGRVYFTVDCIDGKQRDLYPQYQVGEVVAVAQAYQDIQMAALMKQRLDGEADRWPFEELVKQSKGWANKMYVAARLMPHRIRITDIKLERMQDISDEDCRKEGIVFFDKDVYVDDEQYQLHADQAYVFLNGTNDLRRIVAIGHVAMTNDTKRAYGSKVSYYKEGGMVVLYGDEECLAEVRDESKEQDQVVKGRKIKFWIDSEQVEVMEADISAPTSGFGKEGFNQVLGR